MKRSNFLTKNKDVILSVLKSLFLKLLKSQTTGGLKGWLIRTVIVEFSEEVYEFIKVNVDNFEIKKKVNSTITNEDRNEATDDLNDVFNT